MPSLWPAQALLPGLTWSSRKTCEASWPENTTLPFLWPRKRVCQCLLDKVPLQSPNSPAASQGRQVLSDWYPVSPLEEAAAQRRRALAWDTQHLEPWARGQLGPDQ